MFNLTVQSSLISFHSCSFLTSVFSYPTHHFAKRGGVTVTLSTRIWCWVQTWAERLANTRLGRWLGHGRVFKHYFPLILDLSTSHSTAHNINTEIVVNYLTIILFFFIVLLPYFPISFSSNFFPFKLFLVFLLIFFSQHMLLDSGFAPRMQPQVAPCGVQLAEKNGNRWRLFITFAYAFTIHCHKPNVAFLPRAVEVSTPSEAIPTEDFFMFSFNQSKQNCFH